MNELKELDNLKNTFSKIEESLSKVDLSQYKRPVELTIKPVDYNNLFSKYELPEISSFQEVIENVTSRQDEQINNQNKVIENQNKQIEELQNLLILKNNELEEIKISSKKSSKWNWILGITAIISGIAGVVSMIFAIIK